MIDKYKNIIYYLRVNDDKDVKTEWIWHDKFHFTFVKANPKTWPGSCGQRHWITYCDKTFLDDKTGREFLDVFVFPWIPKDGKIIFI